MAEEESVREYRWVQFTVDVTLPMGIGVDEANVITEVDPNGAGGQAGLEPNDELLWIDGMEVRGGEVPIVEAIDRDVDTHLLVLRRVDDIRMAEVQPEYGWAQEIGPVELPLPMGIGMNASHRVLELDGEGSAVHDGTLQARLAAPPLPSPHHGPCLMRCAAPSSSATKSRPSTASRLMTRRRSWTRSTGASSSTRSSRGASRRTSSSR